MSNFEFCSSFYCVKYEGDKKTESDITPRMALEHFNKPNSNRKHPSNNVSSEATDGRENRRKVSIRQSMEDKSSRAQCHKLDISNVSEVKPREAREEELDLNSLLMAMKARK